MNESSYLYKSIVFVALLSISGCAPTSNTLMYNNHNAFQNEYTRGYENSQHHCFHIGESWGMDMAYATRHGYSDINIIRYADAGALRFAATNNLTCPSDELLLDLKSNCYYNNSCAFVDGVIRGKHECYEHGVYFGISFYNLTVDYYDRYGEYPDSEIVLDVALRDSDIKALNANGKICPYSHVLYRNPIIPF